MKIRADKAESAHPHNLRIRDVKLILKAVPPEWINDLKEVRLANSLEYYKPYAFFSRYDGCFTIYSRRGTKIEALNAVLSALAVEALGINRGIGRHRSEAETHRIDELIRPLVKELLPAINAPSKVGFSSLQPFPSPDDSL
jgi:hypothetical protein